MHPKLAEHEQMTIEEFLGFTAERPDEEHWELIEGVPVLNASPSDYHQLIVRNISMEPTPAQLASGATWGATWIAFPGVGTRVPMSPNSLPQPDVVVKAGKPTGTSLTDEALVLFEILSPSTTRADQTWRRRVYSSVPNCRHYVTVSQRTVSVIRYDRDAGWGGTDFEDIAQVLDLAGLGVTLPLAKIYRNTPFAP